MSFTIGTALTDARDNRLVADLLVEGHWLHGTVTAVDGFGAVLEREDGSHSVVRIESISAIEVETTAQTGNHRELPRQMAIAR